MSNVAQNFSDLLRQGRQNTPALEEGSPPTANPQEPSHARQAAWLIPHRRPETTDALNDAHAMATGATSSQASQSLPREAEAGDGTASGYACEPGAPESNPLAELPRRQLSLRTSRRQLSDYRQQLTREMSARISVHTVPTSPAAASLACPSARLPASSDTTPAPAPVTAVASPAAGPSSTSASSFPLPRSLATTSSAPPRQPDVDGHADGQGPQPAATSNPPPLTHHRPDKMKMPPTPPSVPSSTPFLPSDALGHDANGLNGATGANGSYGSNGANGADGLPAGTHGNRGGTHGNRDGTHGNRGGTHGNHGGTHGNRGGTHGHHPNRHYPTIPEFETPNLYDLTLTLSSEPGLDAWWNNVVQVTTQCYKAERVVLSVPADPTDVGNIPWGQRATFNAHEGDDELSLGYLSRDTHAVPSTTSAAVSGSETTPMSPPSASASSPVTPASTRPPLLSRHSYTAYESHRCHKADELPGDGQPPQTAYRHSLLRCQSMRPSLSQRVDMPFKADLPPRMPLPKPFVNLNHEALEEHDAAEEKAGHSTSPWERSSGHQEKPRGRVLPMLQSLNYEADPLIDHDGVQRVLTHGGTIVLTRSYPYLHANKDDAEDGRPVSPGLAGKPGGVVQSPGSASRPSSYFMKRLNGLSSATSRSAGAAGDEVRRPRPSMYEEFEQFCPSPWTQTPAASPAVRTESDENPFFRDAVVDEDSFNLELAPKDYKNLGSPLAIGIDNSWSVLHVPLFHPVLSKLSPCFKLDATKMQRKSSPRRHVNGSDHESSSSRSMSSSTTASSVSPERPIGQSKRVPIAILSILSPIIPYPSNLRRSLELLAPHLATSFSLCLHYSNLETELSGLQRRRQDLSGFGAVNAEGHVLSAVSVSSNTPCLSCFQSDDVFTHQSLAGSAASFSDFSGPSRSVAGSPSGTPGWDASSTLNTFLDRRTNTGSGMSPSVASLGGDGYFGTRPTTVGHFGRPVTTPGGSSNGSVPRTAGKQYASATSAGEKRLMPLQTLNLAPSLSGASALPPAGYSEASATSPVYGHAKRPPPRRSSTLYEESPEAEIEEVSAGKGVVSWGGELDQPVVAAAVTAAAETGGAETASACEAGNACKEASLDELARSALGAKTLLAKPLSPVGHQPVRRHSQRALHRHSRSHSHLHSQGADFASTFPCLPPSSTICVKGAGGTGALGSSATTPAAAIGGPTSATRGVDMPPPSDRLKGLILDSLPAHVFVAMPQTGAIVWVNSRYLAYRGQTAETLAEDPWGSIHPDEREAYLKAWSNSVRTGDQFSRTVRIRRFDGAYRWFHARAVASRDRRNAIMQFLGSYMDIHDQYIAELKAARQEEIEASESKHRVLANLIPQIVFTANEQDGVTFVNEQWLVYTGQSQKGALGVGFINFVHQDDIDKCWIIPTLSGEERGETYKGELAEMARRGLLMVSADGDGRLSYATEVRLLSKTGEYRWHLVRCAETEAVGFGRGSSNSYFGSATDINDHKLLETRLKDAMESKTRFLSNMSHEIRTPLIGISGMVSFLQDTTLDEEQRDYADTIQSSASSLLMIINDILDLSKVDAGMMKLSFEWFHTQALIEDVNDLVSAMALGKGLDLNYIVEDAVPSWVRGDRVRIRQVLLNVVGNAIKFTAQGEVFIWCRVLGGKPEAEADPGHIMLEFLVIDTGQGFTREEADLIFKPFSQIDGSSTRQHGGSGLGLVISRQLVELHGGHMEGTAEPGQGSTFTFTARFELPAEGEEPARAVTPELGVERSVGVERPTGQAEEKVESQKVEDTVEGESHQEPEDQQVVLADSQAVDSTDGLTDTPDHFSILVVCPLRYSRAAMVHHIQTTLPKESGPHEIVAVATAEDAETTIAAGDAAMFTHVVTGLGSAEEVLGMMQQLDGLGVLSHARVVVVSDPAQRQSVQRLVAETQYREMLETAQMVFVYKPLKPSRFAAVFDPAKERDLSVDQNRTSANLVVETQKQSYEDLVRLMGDRAYRVLLVEDNPVNQKVLVRYLQKIGVALDLVLDGVECVEAVLRHPHDHYALVLCDIHMPRKDGYQACREIRDWEAANGFTKQLPIIALSANVMADVYDKCVEAGFSKYITKPVDFIALSHTLAKFF